MQNAGLTQSYNRYSYTLNNPLIYTDPDGEFAWLAAGIFAAFTYFKTAYDNRNPETGKWAWNPKSWFGKDKNTTVIVGINTNTSFSNVTGFTGVGVGPYMPAVAVNSNNGVGFGVYTPQGADFVYPGVKQRADYSVVNSAINDARKYGPLGQGDNYLGTANNWLNGAGYLSGGIGAFQIGMLDYRSSLSLSSKIGTFSKFSSTYRLLGTTEKILGGASTYVGAPLSIGLDYSAMQNGQISDGLFAYRTTGTLSSIGGGALIGSTYGGPWGAAGGALIGTGFVAGEYIYNGANYIWNETLWQISNFENAIKSGWYPGR